MAHIHWQFIRQLDEGRDYVLVATTGLRIPWFRPARMWRFTRYTLGILGQLRRTEGCFGYSLRTSPSQESTVSIWENLDALGKFQRGTPHASAMRALRSSREHPFRYAKWTASHRTLPHEWEEVAAHFGRSPQPA